MLTVAAPSDEHLFDMVRAAGQLYRLAPQHSRKTQWYVSVDAVGRLLLDRPKTVRDGKLERFGWHMLDRLTLKNEVAALPAGSFLDLTGSAKMHNFVIVQSALCVSFLADCLMSLLKPSHTHIRSLPRPSPRNGLAQGSPQVPSLSPRTLDRHIRGERLGQASPFSQAPGSPRRKFCLTATHRRRPSARRRARTVRSAGSVVGRPRAVPPLPQDVDDCVRDFCEEGETAGEGVRRSGGRGRRGGSEQEARRVSLIGRGKGRVVERAGWRGRWWRRRRRRWRGEAVRDGTEAASFADARMGCLACCNAPII